MQDQKSKKWQSTEPSLHETASYFGVYLGLCGVHMEAEFQPIGDLKANPTDKESSESFWALKWDPIHYEAVDVGSLGGPWGDPFAS